MIALTVIAGDPVRPEADVAVVASVAVDALPVNAPINVVAVTVVAPVMGPVRMRLLAVMLLLAVRFPALMLPLTIT